MNGVVEGQLVPGTVALAASGDEEAFGRIVALYDDDIVRVAYLVSGDVSTAHEAAAATWSIAWRKLRSLRDDRQLRAWLAAVAGNEARQLMRRQRRHTVREISLETFSDTPSRDSGPTDREATIDLMAALRQLAPQDRAIVAMRYVLGLSSTEISNATGLRPQACALDSNAPWSDSARSLAMADGTIPMDVFERRLAEGLVHASSVALRSVDPLAVAREARSHQGFLWTVLAPGRLRSPLNQQLVRIGGMALLVLLLVVALASFFAGGPFRPLPVVPLHTLEPSTRPSNSPDATPSAAVTTPTTVQTPGATDPAGQGSAYHLGRLAYIARAGGLFVANADGSNAVKVADEGSNPVWYGANLVYSDDARARTVVLGTDGQTRDVGPSLNHEDWRVSPDGRTFVFPSPERATVLFPDGSSVDLLPPSGYEIWDSDTDVSSVAWMPDGKAIVMSACKLRSTCDGPVGKHALFRVPIDGSPPLRLDLNAEPPAHAVISPNGKLIAFLTYCGCGAPMVMRSDGSETWPMADVEKTVASTESFVWSADSNELALAYTKMGDSPGARGVWIVDANSFSEPRQIAPSVGGPVTMDDGTIVLSGEYRVWGFAPDNSAVLATGPSLLVDDGLWSIPTDGSEPERLADSGGAASWEWVPNN